MNSNQSVSVIIPVHNRPELLKRSVQSVIDQLQTLQTIPVELIVSINHDKDDDFQIHRRSTEEAIQGRIDLKVIQVKEASVSIARNRAAEIATHRYLAFLDSDDYFLPGKIASQLQFLAKRPHLIACHSAEIWNKNSKEIPIPRRLQPSSGQLLERAIDVCIVSPSTLLIEKSVFVEAGGFDESFPLCEDYEFLLRFFVKYSAGYIPVPFTVKSSGNWPQLSATPGIDYYRILALYKNLKVLKNYGLQEKAIQSIRNRFSILRNATSYGRDIQLKQKVEELYKKISYLLSFDQ